MSNDSHYGLTRMDEVRARVIEAIKSFSKLPELERGKILQKLDKQCNEERNGFSLGKMPSAILQKISCIEATVHILRILKSISPRVEKVVVLRYGLDGNPDRTLEEIGRKMGVSRQRICQIESKALDLIYKRLPPFVQAISSESKNLVRSLLRYAATTCPLGFDER
ncbi:MAG: sigma factor-like helix-turn-helix DNA-binding protein [Nitrospinota bacterium]